MNPLKSIPYVDEYKMDAIINPYDLSECQKSSIGKISTLQWRKCFPSDYKEKTYFGVNDCTFNIVIDIIQNVSNQQITIDELRKILNSEFNRLTNNFTDKIKIQKIADILSEQGKKIFADQIVERILSFTEMVYTYSYFITNFDLWILLNYFKIPSIFISNVNISETRYNEKQFVVYTNENSNNNYIFIITPGLREKNIPEYKIVINNRNSMNISIDNLNTESDCYNKIANAIKSYVSIDEYLNVFTRDSKYKYIKKQKDLRKKPINILEEKMLLEEETPSKPTFIEEEVNPLTKKVLIEEEDEEPIPNVLIEEKGEFVKPVTKVLIEEEEEKEPIKVIKSIKPRTRKILIEDEEEEKEEKPLEDKTVFNKPFVKQEDEKEEEEEIIVPVKRKKQTKKKIEIRPQERRKQTKKLPVNFIEEE
jgi:hypothetical protein